MVPPGTEIWRRSDSGDGRLADLLAPGQRIVVARGGRGGWGNARFATSVHRAPRFAQRGGVGEQVRLRLDLKLLADVGIVGLPNAGKSTLLRAISAARPKVADYPFTTLEPVLGVAHSGWETIVVADIPGLIEGAHEGVGLGLDFLRHIERTKVVVHLIDGSSTDVLSDVETIEAELASYSRELGDKKRITVVNKVDIPEVAARAGEIADVLRARGLEPQFISAAAQQGTGELVALLAREVSAVRDQEAAPQSVEPLAPAPAQLKEATSVTREDGLFRVAGERAVAFAQMMPLEEEEARAELWRRFGRWGITSALRRAGARAGDRVLVGNVEVEYLA